MGKQDVNEYDKSYHPPETIKLDYFIRVCFNSESARAKGKFRLTGNTAKTLYNLVFLRMFKRMGRIPMFKHGKRQFAVDAVLDGGMPALAQRALIKQYMDAGFKLKHSKGYLDPGVLKTDSCLLTTGRT